MKKNKLEQIDEENSLLIKEENFDILRKKTIKELIAPSGIDASNIDRLEIISNTTRYARSFFVSRETAVEKSFTQYLQTSKKRK